MLESCSISESGPALAGPVLRSQTLFPTLPRIATCCTEICPCVRNRDYHSNASNHRVEWAQLLPCRPGRCRDGCQSMIPGDCHSPLVRQSPRDTTHGSPPSAPRLSFTRSVGSYLASRLRQPARPPFPLGWAAWACTRSGVAVGVRTRKPVPSTRTAAARAVHRAGPLKSGAAGFGLGARIGSHGARR